MAEVTTNNPKTGRPKVSTRIDMTPMVDLAFLLITFFMLTTTFSKPKAMPLTMPEKGETPRKVAASRTTIIVLGENDKVYYYPGTEHPEVSQTDYSAGGIRKVIMQKLRTVEKGPIFIIKAMDASRYGNMVDILDEMNLTGAQLYSMVDVSEGDLQLIENFRQKK
jgi:biopolymer transport protein ExbD